MMVQLDSRYMVSYYGLIVTHCLTLPLQTTNWRNKNQPDFELLRPLNVKCTFAVDFLLVSNSKHTSIYGLAVIDT